MALTTRLTAKLAVMTTLATTGGAGTYCYTTGHGLPFQLHASSKATEATVSAADLDAVANAWGEAKPLSGTKLPGAATADTSRMARSAEVTLAHAELPVKSPASSDRYAVQTQPPLAAQVEPLAQEPPTIVEPAPEPVLTEFAEQQPADVSTAEKPSPSPAPVARGQALDEKPADAAENASIETVSESDPVGDGASQPEKPNSGLNDTARRAKEAFRDPPQPTQPAQPVALDRYGVPLKPTEPVDGANAGVNTGEVINPFAARTSPPLVSPIPSASPREIQPLESAQPLPPAASGLAERTTSSDDNYREGSATNPSRTATAGPTGEYGANNHRQINTLQSPLGDNPANSNAQTLGTIDGTGKPGEHALEGPQKPSLMIQKFAPGEIQVGKPAKFVVQVRNVGSQTAQDVMIRDIVPQGAKLVNTTPKADIDATHITWQIGSLSAGEERTVEMQLMPTTEGEVGSVATVSYSAQASAKTRCTMPQLAIRMTAPPEVMIGAEQRVKIELRNPGSGDATGVMLFENVPQNVKHAAGPALEFEIGTLRAGETRELELVLLAEKAGKVTNVLSARAEGNLQVQQQVEFEVIAPGLAVGVKGPERRYLERPATYEVSIENPGTAPARDIQLLTKLPKGLQFVRANNMGEYDATTHTVYWSLAELPKGERGTVELVAMPVETGTQTLEVEGHAKQGLADQAKQQILVEGLSAIMFEVRDLEDPIEVGRETGFEVRVVNQGTKAATNLQLTVNLPEGLQFVSAEGETNHSNKGGSVVFEPLAQLAPKADTLFRFKAQGVHAGDQRVSVEVKSDDLSQPIRKEESTRVFGDE